MVSYEVIESIVRHVVNNLDPIARFGRPRKYDILKVWYRIQRMLRSSQPWSMMEEPGFSHKTLHRIFIRWCRLGVFQKIHSVILKLYRMKHPLKSDRYYATDTTFVKNIYGTQTIGRNPTDRGRSATKLSVIINQDGCVSNLVMFPANVSDQRVLQRTLYRAQLRRGVAMHADKGYDSASNRNLLHQNGLLDRISRRGQRRYRNAARKRIVVEHFFGRLKQHRRIRNRYDKLDVTFGSFCTLACTCMALRRL